MGKLRDIAGYRKRKRDESDEYFKSRKEYQEFQESYLPGLKDRDMPCAAGHPERLRGLIEMGADVDTPFFEGTNCLTRCAKIAARECIEILLTAGADINFAVQIISSKDYMRDNPAFRRLSDEKFEEIWQQIKAGPETFTEKELIGWTALDFAEQGLEDLKAVPSPELKDYLKCFHLPAGKPENQRVLLYGRFREVIDLLINTGAKRGRKGRHGNES